jgi:hypothetical protein
VHPRLGEVRAPLERNGLAQTVARPVAHGITACPAGGGEKDLVIVAAAGLAPLKGVFQDTNRTAM